jgi:hypothetical protein
LTNGGLPVRAWFRVVATVECVRCAGTSRARSLARLMAVLTAATLVLSACDSGGQSKSERSQEPVRPLRGQPVARLRIEALPTLSFQADEFRTVPGINEITFVSTGGTETLVFDDPALSHVKLSAPSGPQVAKVDLQAGKRYRIHSSIPGHTAAGREAVILVAPRRTGA